MTNQCSKISRNSAEISKPLRDLHSLKNEWQWGSPQQQAFDQLKGELSDPNKMLAHYSPTVETTVSGDAASFGLGAVLTQRQ